MHPRPTGVSRVSRLRRHRSFPPTASLTRPIGGSALVQKPGERTEAPVTAPGVTTSGTRQPKEDMGRGDAPARPVLAELASLNEAAQLRMRSCLEDARSCGTTPAARQSGHCRAPPQCEKGHTEGQKPNLVYLHPRSVAVWCTN